MSERFDIAVLGSGYGGSLMSMILRRLGYSVVLVERGRHPRTVIGESSTPLSNLLLEELAERYDLPRLKPLCKWGSWQEQYPGIACGLKRGFSFFGHELGDEQRGSPEQMLVAASPHDRVADTHWYRADVDWWLVREAQAMDVAYLDEVDLTAIARESAGWLLSGQRRGISVALRAGLLLDATGPRGALSRLFVLGESSLPEMPKTSALYTHFEGVSEFMPSSASADAGAGYPPDIAALHHVFDGGWMWVLRFGNGATSAGVAATPAIAARFGLAEGQHGWERLLHSLPAVREQFRTARPKEPFRYVPRLAYRSAAIAGPGWAMLPSAAGFVDPLLSTGFSLTLLGIGRLASLLERERDPASPTFAAGLQQYAQETDSDLLATADLVSALYANLGNFSIFRSLSLLYFAAVSYAETARRLDRPELAGSFLLRKHPVFAPETKRIFAWARQTLDAREQTELARAVYTLLAPFDVAGLSAQPANHAYPVRARDLYESAHKVGASRGEIEAMLERSGFFLAA